MKRMILAIGGIAAVFALTGCGNKNVVMPGQEYSDCYVAGDNNGVCGNPMNLYRYRDKIEALEPHPGRIYTIDDEGTIRDKESGKIVVPGGEVGSAESKIPLSVKNKSLVISHPTEMAPIRDLGYTREVWYAPYENNDGALVEAHSVHVVIKKPRWIIGEDHPKNVRGGVLIPSLLTTEVVSRQGADPEYRDIKTIEDYVNGKDLSAEEKRILEYLRERGTSASTHKAKPKGAER
ncbi:MAG: hypothetical protein B6D63_02820 [Candidatus Latescibacteria bacterium 4484_7]|nr:MAG: hypothetical protein B6D63_02820 [Candidatus Latescibacteria bacterium 4484_7]